MNDLLAFLKNANLGNVAPQTEKYVGLTYLLDGTSRAIETYVLLSPTASFAQQTFTEYYGSEHYGSHARNEIRLKNRPIVTITSVIDNINSGGTPLDSSQYTYDPDRAIIYRISGRFFPQPRATQVIYTAGYVVTGQGDTLAIQVPLDIRNACLEQIAYEFTLREPGGPSYGVNSISRPDGSVVIDPTALLPSVKFKLDAYRLGV